MVLRVARVWRVQCATRPTRTVPKMAWYAERTPNHIFFSTPDALCLVFVVHWRAGTSCCERAADRFARLQVHNRDSNNRRLALSGGFDLACRLRTSTLIFFSGAVLCSVTLCGPSLVAEKDFDDAGWTDVGLPLGFGEPGVTFAQDNTDLYAMSPVSLSRARVAVSFKRFLFYSRPSALPPLPHPLLAHSIGIVTVYVRREFEVTAEQYALGTSQAVLRSASDNFWCDSGGADNSVAKTKPTAVNSNAL